MAGRRCRPLELVLATDRSARLVPIPRPRETIESISRRAHSWLDVARTQPTGPPRVLTASLSGAVDNCLKPHGAWRASNRVCGAVRHHWCSRTPLGRVAPASGGLARRRQPARCRLAGILRCLYLPGHGCADGDLLYARTGSVLLAQLMHASSTGFLVVLSAPHVSAWQEAGWCAAYGGLLWVSLLVAVGARALSEPALSLKCEGRLNA
jgi:hypothetical protein